MQQRCATMRASTRCQAPPCTSNSSFRRLSACPSSRGFQAVHCKATQTTAEEAAGARSTEQHTDSSNDPAISLQKLRQEAFEAGYKAGYQRGVQVQVSVSIDLDDDSGSYLQRRQQQQNANSSSSGGSSSSSSGAYKQPWLPQPSQSKASSPSAAAASNSTPRASPSTRHAPSSEAAADRSDPSQKDSIIRSAVKGLVWRVFSTTATVSVVLVLLQDSLQVSDALKFGGIEFATKYVLYFLHERLWAAIALL